MSKINTVVKSGEALRESSHLNWMNGNSWDINDPFLRLKLIAASSFFGEPKYYDDNCEHMEKSEDSLDKRTVEYLRATLNAIDPYEWRSLSHTQIIEKTINECLNVDVEKTLQVASELRNVDNIRTTPQVIMVLAAMHKNSIGTGLIAKYADQIIKRTDEPATQLAYFISKYGIKGKLGDIAIPTRLRKAWKNYLERQNDYSIAKYKMDNRKVKTIDVVRLVHAHSKTIDKLVKKELKLENNTWEDIISKNGSNKETWTKALDVMGHMALLRNIRNLLKYEIDPKEFMPKLIDGVKDGKQLPFRYFSAYRAIEDTGETISPYVTDSIEECLELSYVNCPYFSGKTMSLVDNSGSARSATTSDMGSMRICDIGNLTGIVTAKRSDEGYVGIFGDRLEIVSIRKKSSTFDMIKKVDKIGSTIGGNTENGIWIFFRDAIEKKEHYDNIFVYSDMQAGHGGLYGTNPADYNDYAYPLETRMIDVPKLISRYRTIVNPKVKVFLVQIAGYHDSLVPEFYQNTYILGGWSSNILNFAAQMSNINNKN